MYELHVPPLQRDWSLSYTFTFPLPADLGPGGVYAAKSLDLKVEREKEETS